MGGQQTIWTVGYIAIIVTMIAGIASTFPEIRSWYKELYHMEKSIEMAAVEETYTDELFPNLGIYGSAFQLYANGTLSYAFINKGGANATGRQLAKFLIYDENGNEVAYTDWIVVGRGSLGRDEITSFNSPATYTLKSEDRPIKVGKKYRVDVIMLWYNDAGKSWLETESLYLIAQ